MKVIRILEKEIVTGMRLLGAQRIEDLVPDMVLCLIHAQCPV